LMTKSYFEAFPQRVRFELFVASRILRATEKTPIEDSYFWMLTRFYLAANSHSMATAGA